MFHFYKKIPLIGVWISFMEGRYHQLLSRGMLDGAEKSGAKLIFFNGSAIGSPYPGHIDDNAVYRLCTRERQDGLLLPADTVGNYAPPQYTEALIARFGDLPLLTIGQDQQTVPNIFCDNHQGMTMLMNHLTEHHRFKRFAYVRGPRTNRDSREREEAFRSVLEMKTIPIADESIYTSDYTLMSCFRIAEEILERGIADIDALVCSNDETALALMRMFSQKGIQVPADITITGFDDYPSSFLSIPPLTTVHQPIYDMGFQGVVQLAAMIRGETVPMQTVLPAELVVRESCGCSGTGIDTNLFRGFKEPLAENEKNADSGPERQLLTGRDEILETVFTETVLRKGSSSDYRKALSDLLDIMVFDLRNHRRQPLCLTVFSEWLNLTLSTRNANEIWQNLLVLLRREILRKIRPGTLSELTNEIFLRMFAMLSQQIQLQEQQSLYRLKQFVNDMESTMEILKTSRNEDELIRILRQDLPILNSGLFALLLFTDYPLTPPISDTGLQARLALLINPRNNGPEKSGTSFFAGEILPAELTKEMRPANLVLMELHHKGRHYGYMMMEAGNNEPVSYRLIRNQIASAMASVTELKSRETETQLRQYSREKDQMEFGRLKLMLEKSPCVPVLLNRDLSVISAAEAFKRDFPSSSILDDIDEKTKNQMTAWIDGLETSEDFSHLVRNSDGKIWPILGKVNERNYILLYLLSPEFIRSSSTLELEPFYRTYKLTPREKEITRLLVIGLKNKDVGEKLFIAESTVKTHIKDLYRKLGISSRKELTEKISAAMGREMGREVFLRELLSHILTNT